MSGELATKPLDNALADNDAYSLLSDESQMDDFMIQSQKSDKSDNGEDDSSAHVSKGSDVLDSMSKSDSGSLSSSSRSEDDQNPEEEVQKSLEKFYDDHYFNYEVN